MIFKEAGHNGGADFSFVTKKTPHLQKREMTAPEETYVGGRPEAKEFMPEGLHDITHHWLKSLSTLTVY